MLFAKHLAREGVTSQHWKGINLVSVFGGKSALSDQSGNRTI
jgi:hypothetical protein